MGLPVLTPRNSLPSALQPLKPSMNLGSLLFPLEVEEATPHGSLEGPAADPAHVSLLRENLKYLIRPQSVFQSKLLRDVVSYKERMRAEEEDFDVVTLAAWLSSLGYRVAIRSALGGGSGTDCFHNLRHEFLVVQGEGERGSGVNFIVEPAFQAQFKISHATPRYNALLAMVPSDLVTTAAMLGPLVQLLCAEMHLAFEHHGLSLPPWRQAKSMLSKWLPQKSKDVEPSPYASPRAASPEASLPLLGAATAGAVGPAGPATATATSATAPSSTGCQTPGGPEADPVSPRAVLSGASAVLISQASVAHPQAQPSKFRAKSLLSDRLAGAAAAPAPPAAEYAPGHIPQRGCSSRSASGDLGPAPAQLPPAARGGGVTAGAGPPGLYRVSGGVVYRVDSDWQEPPIRTVKMQGGAAPQK